MSSSKQRIEQAKQRLASLGQVESRTQFGGYSLSVAKTVFAVVADGELYLRACEQVQPYIIERKMQPLHLVKRGLSVELNYYRVDGALWTDPDQLLALSSLCLNGARQELWMRLMNRRIKDLPNMGIRMEAMLRDVGICSIAVLIEQGAKRSWLKLRANNKHLGLSVLLALEGAIVGSHYQALPTDVKEELRDWFRRNSPWDR
ncbi:TfoX/Sxy family DNA transformation protein [Erwinia sp. SLM-02]|uniref:TfoX/Sxy family DNA transformation protein n=1 Tax=Erwinia sp. SLM-02 TaxID=3020057 RepID=UPI0028D01CD7|nr:TfoX/Sxy family DNA transformation protein [uncultured Erwinia sp.]